MMDQSQTDTDMGFLAWLMENPQEMVIALEVL